MTELLEQINTIVQNNQVLSTVAGGSVVVWLVSNIKTFYHKIVGAIQSLISFTIVNIYEDNRGGGGGWCVAEEQEIFNEFVCSSKAIWERTKNLDLGQKETISRSNLQGAYGYSIRIMFGKLVVCNRSIEKGQKITVATTLRVYFARKKKFMQTLTDYINESRQARQIQTKARQDVRVYNGTGYRGTKCKRPMDSIFTNHDEHYMLLDAIKTFYENKEKYIRLSYPYSFSALLYGKPGCGKSSTILAIASALNKDICYVNLSKISLNYLLERLNGGGGEIVVFEDIDALSTAVSERRTDEKGKDAGEEGDVPEPSGDPTIETAEDVGRGGLLVEPVGRNESNTRFGQLNSLSDILNFTDGLLASDGTVCLFTTNHIEKLDPALLRAGRMNEIIEFSDLDAETAAKMIKSNLDWDVPPSELQDAINPAELQTEILKVVLGKSSREKLLAKFSKKQVKES